MSDITVIAHIHARPGHEELVQRELAKLVPPTRAEPGCKRYDLHRDLKDSGHFFFYETWDSAESHETHMDSAHMADFVVACKGAIAESGIYHLAPCE